MVSLVDAVGLLVIVGLNSLAAALATRLFRVRLNTRWGAVLYTVLLTPVVLVVVTLVLSGLLKLGPELGGRATVFGVTVLVPLALGMAFDYFWQPAPEEVDLPETYEEA